jgi:hypothetical protein
MDNRCKYCWTQLETTGDYNSTCGLCRVKESNGEFDNHKVSELMCFQCGAVQVSVYPAVIDYNMLECGACHEMGTMQPRAAGMWSPGGGEVQ